MRFDWIERIRLGAPSTGPPDIASLVSRLEKPWGTFVGFEEANGNYTTWATHDFATTDSNYGRTRNVVFGEAILAALLDLPTAEKRALVEVCVQTGIDVVSVARTGSEDNPVRWGQARGGLGAGFWLPAFVLATLTEDEEVFALFHGNRDLVQEFAQTAFLTPELAPFGYSKPVDASSPRYDSPVAVGDVVWGTSFVPRPHNSGANWTAYRWCCTANAWHAGVLFCDLMTKFNPEVGDLRAKAGHDAFFAYLDTYESECNRLRRDRYQWAFSDLFAAMWDAYRGLGPARFVQPSQR